MGRGMNAKPKHQDADANSKYNQACQTLLKPNKKKADKGCQKR
jgi:hypothetical protein